MQIQIGKTKTSFHFPLKIEQINGKIFLKSDWNKIRIFPPLEILRIIKGYRTIRIFFMDQIHLIHYYKDWIDHKEKLEARLIRDLSWEEYWSLFD